MGGSRREMIATGLEKLLLIIARFLNAVSAYLILPSLAIVIAVDVTMRYVVGKPIIAAAEASQFLLLLLFTLGLSFTTHTEQHIRMDMLLGAMGKMSRLIVEFLSMIAGIILFGALAIQSYRDISYSRLISERTEELEMLIWPIQGLLMAVFFFVCLQIFIRTLLKIFTHSTAPDPDKNIEAGVE
tara:strand:+ start:1119 stop:1673 length:555 start_codon:yes stop_codon:yes gene_type:complete